MIQLPPFRTQPTATERDYDALLVELTKLRSAVALLATRMTSLSDDDGRILVDLLSPATRKKPTGGA
jgi:hypothetical protein